MMKQKPEKAKENKMANCKEINMKMLTFDMDAVNENWLTAKTKGPMGRQVNDLEG